MVIHPSAKITSPRPATIHQTVWVASVKAGPPRAIAAPAIDPDMATTGVIPTWRPAGAIAAAGNSGVDYFCTKTATV